MINERKKRNKRNAGFTLIELLVVITIIAILGAVVAPKLFSHSGRAKVSAAKAQMEGLQTAADSYHLTRGKPIGSFQDLVPEFFDAEDLPTTDPWGGSYSIQTRGDGSVKITCANYETEKAKLEGASGSTVTIGGGK